mmetsp:Transcript_75395/g.213133  ORF Transcript_75395/g.213133 Transcript_75395/m.213133 type:complete len:211 (+) Transcript_75395:370-1002(+)
MSFSTSSFFRTAVRDFRFSMKRAKPEPRRSATSVSAAQPGTPCSRSSPPAAGPSLPTSTTLPTWRPIASSDARSADRHPTSSEVARSSWKSLPRKLWHSAPRSAATVSCRSGAGSVTDRLWAADFTSCAAAPRAVSAAMNTRSCMMPAPMLHLSSATAICSSWCFSMEWKWLSPSLLSWGTRSTKATSCRCSAGTRFPQLYGTRISACTR